jgi:hypothetical protein
MSIYYIYISTYLHTTDFLKAVFHSKGPGSQHRRTTPRTRSTRRRAPTTGVPGAARRRATGRAPHGRRCAQGSKGPGARRKGPKGTGQDGTGHKERWKNPSVGKIEGMK